MLIGIQKPSQRTKADINYLLVVCGWTLVVAMSLLVNISAHRHEIVTISTVVEPMWGQTEVLWATHGVMWLLGVLGLTAGFTGLKRRTEKCDMAEEELRRVNKVLENQATTDSLTGIYNRRKFLELLQMEIHESKRYEVPVELIFFDIDHFKEINDNYGHEAGDSVLQELTRLVNGMIRQADIFARFGGEEFVILAHNSDVGAGCELAEKIRRAVHQHSFTQVGRVTCSFGVAQYLPDDTTDSIIKRADDAMYSAKKRGRNLVENFCDCQL